MQFAVLPREIDNADHGDWLTLGGISVDEEFVSSFLVISHWSD